MTIARVASVLGVSSQKAAEELARDPLRSFVYAKKGQIVGFGGLAAAPMHHEFRVKEQMLWTWCAWDSLFIPAILGDTAHVSSPDPQTLELVRVTVSPTGIERVEPEDAVVSFPLPGDGDFAHSAENVMGTFWHAVFFFTSRDLESSGDPHTRGRFCIRSTRPMRSGEGWSRGSSALSLTACRAVEPKYRAEPRERADA